MCHICMNYVLYEKYAYDTILCDMQTNKKKLIKEAKWKSRMEKAGGRTHGGGR